MGRVTSSVGRALATLRARMSGQSPVNVMGRMLTAVLFVPGSFVVAPVLARLRIRVWLLDPPDRIGHLATEPDMYVKDQLLGLREADRITVLLVRRDVAANQRMLDYWRQYFLVVSSRFLWVALRPLAFRSGVGVKQKDIRLYINVNERTARFPEIQRRYRRRPPLLELTAEDVQRGDAATRELGVPEGAWFVCFHCREFGFDRDGWHSYRNANIQNFVPAMQTVVDAGGWAIRMGDPTMTPLEPAPGMIDYAHHPARRDWMDIYLLASCRFFVGTTSGLWGPANVFGRPCAIANQTPASRVLPYGAGDIGIPMLYWSEREQRCLSFPEVMRSPASNWSGSSQFRDAGLKMVENDAVDIEAITREMMDTVDGRVEYSDEDEALQAAFIGLMHDGHYSYGADARVGRDFLRRHRELLSEPTGQEASAASLSAPDSPAARSSASRAGESTATRNPDSGSA